MRHRHQVELWALQEVENIIAEGLCGKNDIPSSFGVAERDGLPTQPMLSMLDSFSLPSRRRCTHSARSYMKEMLAVGDAALSTLPPDNQCCLLRRIVAMSIVVMYSNH